MKFGSVAGKWSRFFGRGRSPARSPDISSSPFNWFGGISYINLDSRPDRRQAVQMQLSRFGIESVCSRFGAIETPENHHIGCALSHRAVIAEARQRGLKSILVLEDDVVFHRKTVRLLGRMVQELDSVEWDLFYLGGHTWGSEKALVAGSSLLRAPRAITTTHAIAYNHTALDALLHALPENRRSMKEWLVRWKGFDQYLSRSSLRKVVAHPMVAMQRELFEQPDPPKRKDFGL